MERVYHSNRISPEDVAMIEAFWLDNTRKSGQRKDSAFSSVTRKEECIHFLEDSLLHYYNLFVQQTNNEKRFSFSTFYKYKPFNMKKVLMKMSLCRYCKQLEDTVRALHRWRRRKLKITFNLKVILSFRQEGNFCPKSSAKNKVPPDYNTVLTLTVVFRR